jgi:hypothetical protein
MASKCVRKPGGCNKQMSGKPYHSADDFLRLKKMKTMTVTPKTGQATHR